MALQAIIGSLFQEGTSQTRPPILMVSISLTEKLEWRRSSIPMT